MLIMSKIWNVNGKRSLAEQWMEQPKITNKNNFKKQREYILLLNDRLYCLI